MNIIEQMEKLIELFDCSEQELLEQRQEVPQPQCGVYFLFNHEQLVYVGKSLDVLNRVQFHRAEKEITHYTLIECQEDIANCLEPHFIAKFDPPLNFSMPSNPLYKSSAQIIGLFQELTGQAFKRLLKKYDIKPYTIEPNIYYLPEIEQAIGLENGAKYE
jgi:excinuclease UvrABC nuclease subunit